MGATSLLGKPPPLRRLWRMLMVLSDYIAREEEIDCEAAAMLFWLVGRLQRAGAHFDSGFLGRVKELREMAFGLAFSVSPMLPVKKVGGLDAFFEDEYDVAEFEADDSDAEDDDPGGGNCDDVPECPDETSACNTFLRSVRIKTGNGRKGPTLAEVVTSIGAGRIGFGTGLLERPRTAATARMTALDRIKVGLF